MILSDTEQIPVSDKLDQDTWDYSFGLPLMSCYAKQKYTDNMNKNHQKYLNSMSEYTEHQTDKSIILQKDIEISKFNRNNDNSNIGKKIKDIFDEQTANINVPTKNIINQTDNLITYDNESSMNAGNLLGASFSGFEHGCNFKNVTDDNDF